MSHPTPYHPASLPETGLAALRQGQHQEAIAILEAFCQGQPNDSRAYLQAQMHLVEAHQNAGQMEQAIALCEQLIASENAQVQIWAQLILPKLRPESEAQD
jgi:tetratricopeptide (TPR) repeat protein